jgi:fructokinase
MQNPSIVCFGDVLWDMLPGGKVAGGAPMNVAHHAQQLGLPSTMISSVGKDELGGELLRFLEGKGIPTRWIQRSTSYPTSSVQVHLDEKGSASYEIVEGVAWDDIQLQESMWEVVKEASAIVFGSLATRTATSKETLLALLAVAPLRVFDINLRAPFYSRSSIEALLGQADIVKVNDDELDMLADWYGQAKEMDSMTRFVRDKFQLQRIIVTRGGEGAICRDDTGLHAHPGFPITVKDTVGSGDSFLAAFLTQMLKGQSTGNCLAFACGVGALVATKSGGTPAIDQQMVWDFMHR